MDLLEGGTFEPYRSRDGIVNASLFVFAVPPKRLPVELELEV